MQKVEFEEGRYRPMGSSISQRGIMGLLIRKGIARNIKQANMILIAVTLICLAAIYFLVSGRNSALKNTSSVYREDIPNEDSVLPEIWDSLPSRND